MYYQIQKTEPRHVLLSPRIELRAMGKIPEGEELTVSYVDFLILSADRQKKLKEHYHFDCTCKQCSQHIKDDLMMAAAESEGNKVRGHRGHFTVHKGDFSWVCVC